VVQRISGCQLRGHFGQHRNSESFMQIVRRW
jgi:hypothetical protein